MLRFCISPRMKDFLKPKMAPNHGIKFTTATSAKLHYTPQIRKLFTLFPIVCTDQPTEDLIFNPYLKDYPPLRSLTGCLWQYLRRHPISYIFWPVMTTLRDCMDCIAVPMPA